MVESAALLLHAQQEKAMSHSWILVALTITSVVIGGVGIAMILIGWSKGWRKP